MYAREGSNSRMFIALIAPEVNIQFFRMPGGKLFVLNPLFQGRKRHITTFLETATLMLVCLLFPISTACSDNCGPSEARAATRRRC